MPRRPLTTPVYVARLQLWTLALLLACSAGLGSCRSDEDRTAAGDRAGGDAGPDGASGSRGGADRAEGAREGAAAGEVDAATLTPLLARAAEPGKLTDADRQALEAAMQRALEPGLANGCAGCATTIAYVDEEGGGDRFRASLRDANGDVAAEIELYHRARLAPEAAAAWGRRALHGHPASAFDGEHLFVWPGRCELRVFGRGAGLRDAAKLEALVESLPLDSLAKL